MQLMDTNKITLVMDIWEGRPYLDMHTLYTNGIRGMIIRINDTFGSLHLDEYFKTHWESSEHFYRIPYFVFWPGYTAIGQYQWIIQNLPPEVKVIGIDVELDCKWTNPLTVAQVLDDLVYRLQEHGLKVIIYSGSWWWNTQHIESLPSQSRYEYWWAGYPYLLQPNNAHVFSTWENLKGLIEKLDWNPGTIPGPKCKLWQVCSRYSLPGTGGQNVDINIFNGTEIELKDYFGSLDVLPPPPVEKSVSFISECIVDIQNVRSGPGTNYSIVGTIERSRINPVLGFYGKDVWIKIGENRWVASRIGSTIYQKVNVI